MDIAALEAFIAVARHESFSKASLALHLTQPAVSKRVASLEEELGAQLFNRIARQISLTEAGKQLLPRAQDLVDQAEDMQRYASNLNDKISGNLSVAIAHHVGLHRMPPILKAFNRAHSKVALDIRFEDSDQAFHMVEQGDIEFAVITLPSELPQNLIKKTVWLDPLSIVVGKEHPLANNSKNITSLQKLVKYQCVLPSQGTETHQIMQRVLEKDDLSMNVQMETNNLETLKMLVAADIGWSLLPDSMLDGSLQKVNIGQTIERKLGLVMHRKRSLSNAAKALRKLILEPS